ncbi:wall-associated receptor kinase 2-like [Cornus florida]|uniref:wall-associated receptor kinase 2-like n=1 Tax=Cornus florida TaxID=4283 RepID=UPI00289F3846|nr:wall-associated receptor kinase 2-like [Cornus florida]
MALHVMLVQILSLVLLKLTSAPTASPTTTAAAIAKPGCADRCGNISIPYPFGMTPDCYLDHHFLITCDNSFNPPKAFLENSSIKINVTNISLQGQLHILKIRLDDCYDQRGKWVSNSTVTNTFTLSKFFISNTQNKFTAVGCDTYAIVNAYRGDEWYTTGCMSICNKMEDITDGTCSGIGCCQTSIPRGVRNINLTLRSYHNHTSIKEFDPCSYAFVVEQKEFNFSRSYLLGLQDRKKLPMVLDWTIGDETCDVARKNMTSYACKANYSECYEPDNGPGYLCRCFKGYQGNPYLSDGCQDIDECKDPILNKCPKNCVNTAGNYTCSCHKGYHWDYRKNGGGCVIDQLLVITLPVGIAAVVTVLLVGSTWLHIGMKKRKLLRLKEKFFQQNGGLMLRRQFSGREGSTVKIFTNEEMEMATNNYDGSRIIGQGGYGTVYKGYLRDNTIVAIKKSKIVDQSQIEQFINEMVVLFQINHRNVVKFLGCCLEAEVPLLVYEFINNGTLFDHIHNRAKASALSWDIRLRIAAETGGVLTYLHSAASTPIIHRDIKSANILLDDNYTAKVSDFGASRLVPLDQAQLSTLVQGTLGYLDPEYLHTSQLTEKSDVYSFGVVLVELLTGRKALSFDRPETERSLATYFLFLLKEDRLFQVLDDHLVCEGNTEQLKEFAEIARRCLKVKGEERPTMKEVAMELEGLRMVEKHPRVDIAVLDFEETESSSLGERSDAYEYGGGGATNGKFDSSTEHVVLPIDGGR